LISYWWWLFSSVANSMQLWIDQKDWKLIVNWGEGEAPWDVEITAYNYTTKKDDFIW
jgi:hypothetical protein